MIRYKVKMNEVLKELRVYIISVLRFVSIVYLK